MTEATTTLTRAGTYYAAELRGDIDVANRAAEAAVLRVRFVKR